MTIRISDEVKIAAVQKTFSNEFPFLKIEFFSVPHRAGAPGVKKTILPATALLGECRKVHIDGELNIEPGMSVLEVEQLFIRHYGLFAQIFRKSGKVWLETTVTDKWTLEQQNKQGEEMSKIGYWTADNQ
jgi:hypothetical protein